MKNSMDFFQNPLQCKLNCVSNGSLASHDRFTLGNFHLKSGHRNVPSSQSLISESLARSFGRHCVSDIEPKKVAIVVNWVLIKLFPRQNKIL